MKLFILLLVGLHLCAIGAAEAQVPEEFGVTTLTPPTLKINPGPKYWPRLRMWQGIPGIERTAGGRLWATWYCGPIMEGEGEGNYAVLVTSDDDGKTWSRPVAVFDPASFFDGIASDPHLWIDPKGRLWWFVNRLLKVKDANGTRSLWGFCTDNPESASPKWNLPVFAGYGVGLNKPTVLSNGDWLRPVDTYDRSDPERAQFYVSRDLGKSFSLFSKSPVEDVNFSEHIIVERKDGSLFALARTTYGIAQIESFDRGASWKNDHAFTKDRGVNARFFVRRLKSGSLILVVNDDPKTRTNMTAMLSTDEGKTWPHKLLLDDRAGVSYPDGVEGTNSFLYITYDHGRYTKGEQEILFAKITEADIKAGQILNKDSRLRRLINRLADDGGGVRITNEPRKMRAEYEKDTGNAKP